MGLEELKEIIYQRWDSSASISSPKGVGRPGRAIGAPGRKHGALGVRAPAP